MLELLRRVYSGSRTVRPPGPPGLPVLGNLLDAWRDPLRFATELSRHYGDLARYRIGFYSGYLVNHPDHVQHVLQRNHRNYGKQNFNYRMLKPVLGEGLLTADGDHWLRERRLLQPVFHPRRIAGLAGVTTSMSEDVCREWDALARRREPVDIGAEMTRIALRVVCRSLFSIDVSYETGAIGRAFATLNQDVSFRFRTVFVPPYWVPTPRNLAFKRARAELDRFVYGLISTRRRRTDHAEGDLLDMLLAARDESSGEGMTDRQLRDEVLTLLLAGHETTATLLTWTSYLLASHPSLARELKRELDDVLGGRSPGTGDLPELDFMHRVLQESMRLYPPVWIISRTAIEDDEIGGYPIPAGTTLALCAYTMHRHPDYWEKPESFDPTRFTPQAREGRHPYAYFPFGGGPRSCIGSHFAMMEAKLILATIMQRYRLDTVSGSPAVAQPLVTLHPGRGFRATLAPWRE